MEQIVSYRHSIRGALDEYIEKTAFKEVMRSDALIEIAASVAHHSEEGKTFFPQVYLCRDTGKFAKHAPDGEIHLIGTHSNIKEGVKIAMKKCSPLTSRDWDVIIEISEPSLCRFGIFKASSAPTSLSLESSYFDGGSTDLPSAILVTSPRPSMVTLMSSCGKSLTLSFGHEEIVPNLILAASTTITNAVLAKLDESTRGPTQTFLEKILRHGLRACHGTLVCTIDKKWHVDGKLPKLLSDSVRLEPCIDFVRTIQSLKNYEGNTEAICTPISYYDLIAGMLSFDGITIFTNDGKLIAYNAFIHSAKKSQSGEMHGARKRAFLALEKNIGKGILAAFYQSQDGATLFKSA